MTFLARVYRLLYPVAKIYWFLVKPKTNGAGVIIKNNNNLLLVRNTYGDGSWSFPGGGVKKGEIPKAAAVREVFEEVGVSLKKVMEVGSFINRRNHRIDTIYVFKAISEDNSIKIDKNEILEAKWIPFKEVSKLRLSRVGEEMFNKYKNDNT